mmetsp:Transcript_109973/g.344058  ORF Transcript_109973/g.344058 Transcript_109973/m.344058 type:complete len:305 (-) Transcript_109973:278-1192(-)
MSMRSAAVMASPAMNSPLSYARASSSLAALAARRTLPACRSAAMSRAAARAGSFTRTPNSKACVHSSRMRPEPATTALSLSLPSASASFSRSAFRSTACARRPSTSSLARISSGPSSGTPSLAASSTTARTAIAALSTGPPSAPPAATRASIRRVASSAVYCACLARMRRDSSRSLCTAACFEGALKSASSAAAAAAPSARPRSSSSAVASDLRASSSRADLQTSSTPSLSAFCARSNRSCCGGRPRLLTKKSKSLLSLSRGSPSCVASRRKALKPAARLTASPKGRPEKAASRASLRWATASA